MIAPGRIGAKRFEMIRAAFLVLVASGLGSALLALPAEARGVHGLGRPGFGSHGMHGAEFTSGRRHGNDAYTRAASEERDRLLDTKIKSICRGC
jgi:hypothetical protein